MEENDKNEEGKVKAARLESARRFCDMMEEEEDISIAQSVAACRELANWLESTSDEEIILASLDCFSLLLERLGDSFRPLLTLTVGPLLTTLGQPASKIRLAAITLLTNLVEVHTAKEIFELSMNGFCHEEFRIREGCCLFVLSVLKRLGGNSGIEELILSPSGGQQLPNSLVRIGTTDPANNAKMAAIAAICELIKFIGIQAREVFDSAENGNDPFLQHNMEKVSSQLKTKRTEQKETQSGEWLEGISRTEMTRDLLSARLEVVRSTICDDQSDAEEKCKAVRNLRSVLAQHSILGEELWVEMNSFFPDYANNILKTRKLTKSVREVALTIQHMCSISTTPNSLIDDVIVSLVNMLPRIGDSASSVAETVWLALKMAIRKFQHSKVIRVLLKSNPGTNPSLKEVNIPSMRRRIMFLLESILTLWEDARPLRKQKAGIIEAINAGIYDADGETRQCARRAWHGLHSHFPNEAADMLRKLTSAQQNLILGKVAESRRPSRAGSRANSPGRNGRAPATRTQPASRTGSPGRNRNAAAARQNRTKSSRDASPTRTRTIQKSRTTVTSRRGSRQGSPTRIGTGSGNRQGGNDKTVSVIRAITSNMVSDKRAGLTGLKRLLQKQVPFRTPELKKLLEAFKSLLVGRGPLFLPALEVLSEFLVVCGPVLDYPWCNFLVPTLTSRSADSSLPGQSLAGVVRARSSAIENLNPTWQLQAISKLITDESPGCSGPRHRVQALVWMTQLAPRIEGNELQTSEVRLAVIRIAQWGGEMNRNNRNGRGGTQIRKCAHEALTALQTGCPTDFEALLDSLPPTTSETCRYLLEATFSQSNSRLSSRTGSRIGSRATSPSRSGVRIPAPVQNRKNIPSPGLNGNTEKTGNSKIPKFKGRSVSDLTDNLKTLSIEQPVKSEPNTIETGSNQSSATPTSSTPKESADLTPKTKTPEETRPPPSPCVSDPDGDSDNLSPDIIFIDFSKSAPERLIALESIEPELLDESQIGRILLAIEKCLSDSSEPTLQTSSFETLSKFAQLCPNSFKNFTRDLILSIMKLSLVESSELAAQDCLQELSRHLPPATLVDPICTCIAQSDDDELKNVAFNLAIQLPLTAKAHIEKHRAGGDNGLVDITEMALWTRLSEIGSQSLKSKLSTVRKMGCSIIANLAISTDNQAAINDILENLPGTAKKTGIVTCSSCSRSC